MDKDTIIDEMIDFVKCNIQEMLPEKLKNNPLLSFKTELCERTGVLGKSIAHYKGLKFTVFEPTLTNPLGRVTVEGSLHKYSNNGIHNYNDFDVLDVIEVLNDLAVLFDIRPDQCVLKQIELGVNIIPPIPSKTLIKGCFLHGTGRFGWQSTRGQKGAYIQVQRSRKTIKIYDKAQLCRNRGHNIPNEILRIEVKFTKMQHLNSLDIYTISDLLDYGLASLVKGFLLKEWDKVLYCDEVILNQTKYAHNYTNPIYWSDLAESNYQLFKYHRNSLTKIYRNKQSNIKTRVTEIIDKKTKELDLKTTQMYPLCIEYKQGVEDK